MKAETKRKLKAKWERFKIEAPLWAGGSVLVLGVSGWLGALINSAEIKRLKKRVGNDETIIAHNADANNYNWDLAAKKFNDLEEGQRLLMTKAMRETLGEGEKG